MLFRGQDTRWWRFFCCVLLRIDHLCTTLYNTGLFYENLYCKTAGHYTSSPRAG